MKTVRMINREVPNQVDRKLKELKENFNSQIMETMNSIAEKVLPAIESTIGIHRSRLE